MTQSNRTLSKAAKLFLFGCFLLPASLAPVSAPARPFQSYFLAPDIQSNDVKLFPKWIEVLQKTKKTSRGLASVCKDEGPYTPCRLKKWKNFLQGIRNAPLEEKVEKVNAFINETPYIEDIINWGVQDYWETPYEFQARNGDCEDFSIAKFMSLRAIGVPEDIMRVAIVRDLNLGGIIHAVLLVSLDGETYMLDNQIQDMIKAKKVYHYLPLYAINEKHWWQYLVTQ